MTYLYFSFPYPIKCYQSVTDCSNLLCILPCLFTSPVMISFPSLTLIHEKYFPGVFHKHIVTSSFTSENTFKMLIRHCPVVATTYLFHVLISYSKIRNPVLISVRIKMKARRSEVSRKQTFETVLKGEAVATMSKLSRLQTASVHWPHLSIAKIYEAGQHCLEGLSSITVRTVEG